MGGQPAGPQHSGVETVSSQLASFAQFNLAVFCKFSIGSILNRTVISKGSCCS